jgi:hypothetical protein
VKNCIKLASALETAPVASVYPAPIHPYKTITTLHSMIGFPALASNIKMTDT